MKPLALIILVSTCFAIPLITVERDGTAIIEIDEPFQNTFSFDVIEGNFSIEGTEVIPSTHLTLQTQDITSKNGTEWSLKLPFRATVLLPKPVSIVNTPNIEKVSFSFDRVSVVASPGNLYYSLDKQDASSVPLSTVLAALAMLLIAAIALLIYFFLKEGGKPAAQVVQHQAPKEDILRLLTENEKALYTKIAERPGITQKELFALSGLPKSTLSITLKRLISKGLVDRAKVGISVKLYPAKKP
ncbi:MAG: helix-turn-helix domain-containing protein [Candidatus Anstonellales archaeon]